MDYNKALRAVVRVGEGRGFVVAGKHRGEHLVITAGHCIESLPPCHTGSSLEQRTRKLLGPLDAEPTVWAECLFVDLIADLAVLGARPIVKSCTRRKSNMKRSRGR
jgi:hypothetical protein